VSGQNHWPVVQTTVHFLKKEPEYCSGAWVCIPWELLHFCTQQRSRRR
jgi:hypothetical protein